jgi:hypothetical protein
VISHGIAGPRRVAGCAKLLQSVTGLGRRGLSKHQNLVAFRSQLRAPFRNDKFRRQNVIESEINFNES